MSATPTTSPATTKNVTQTPTTNAHLTPTHPYQTRSRSPSPAVKGRNSTSSSRGLKSPTADLSDRLQSLQLEPLPQPAQTSTTGLVYDPRCLKHQANYAHVEKPPRASESFKLLVSSGVYQRCVHIPTRRVTNEELIGLAHTAEHVTAIDATEHYQYGPDELDSETEGDQTMYPDCKFLDSDTYVNRFSSEAARYSIGGLINLMEAVINEQVRNGFAVIRPPGHHADSVKAQGFCLYNNVAVAVEAIRARHPSKVKKVLIVDWDVHHGNGTQNIFYQEKNVLYFSIHRYQGGAFYPHTGSMEETGGDRAPGSNINVPLNFKNLGDSEYIEIFQTLLLPVITEFVPDLIVVSAGFDCAQGDPLGGMEVSSEGFAKLTSLLLTSIPHGRVVMALEGGYNVRAVSEAITACTKTLLGDELPPLSDPYEFLGKRELTKIAQKKDLFRTDLQNVIKIQKKFWKSLSAIASPTPTPATVAASSSTTTPTPTPVTPSIATPTPSIVVSPPSTPATVAASGPNVTLASPPIVTSSSSTSIASPPKH